ncbi:MAG: protein kinase, partial [Ardenticatenales bacterium]|nr:protein kinase [Ardenticatenales bacterium]
MLTAGTLLQNRYEIVQLIGRGGMGAVYEARDQRLGNRVALKQTLVLEESLRRAFEREARILAALHHPILPGVSDHFVEGEGQYLVMRYIPGADLAGLMKEQGSGFPVAQVLGWAEQLLDGLEYMHSQELPVIHRDIKPQNLKVTGRGAIILLDFGLAKGGHSESGQGTGMAYSIFGYTPHYAPLEQIHGSGTDPRSDLYALGATLYHLLTGVEPPDALARATAVLGSQPDPLRPAHEVNPLIPPDVSKLLIRAMAPSPLQRYDSATAMQEALRASIAPASSKPTRVLSEKPDDLPTATLPGVAAVSEDDTFSLPRPAVTPPGETVHLSSPPSASTATPLPHPEPAATPERRRRSIPFLLPLGAVGLLLLLGMMFVNQVGRRDNNLAVTDNT